MEQACTVDAGQVCLVVPYKDIVTAGAHFDRLISIAHGMDFFNPMQCDLTDAEAL